MPPHLPGVDAHLSNGNLKLPRRALEQNTPVVCLTGDVHIYLGIVSRFEAFHLYPPYRSCVRSRLGNAALLSSIGGAAGQTREGLIAPT